MRIVCLLFVFLLINGCTEDPCRYHPEGALPKVEIEVNRLEKVLFEAQEVTEVEKFLRAHEQMAARMFHLNEYPDEKILAERIFGVVQKRGYRHAVCRGR
jgi:hypothetical protein